MSANDLLSTPRRVRSRLWWETLNPVYSEKCRRKEGMFHTGYGYRVEWEHVLARAESWRGMARAAGHFFNASRVDVCCTPSLKSIFADTGGMSLPRNKCSRQTKKTVNAGNAWGWQRTLWSPSLGAMARAPGT